MTNHVSELLTNEVFMAPATEIIEQRFVSSVTAADCSGHCKSGHCMGFINHDTSYDCPEFCAL